jgi:hypothetical protein
MMADHVVHEDLEVPRTSPARRFTAIRRSQAPAGTPLPDQIARLTTPRSRQPSSSLFGHASLPFQAPTTSSLVSIDPTGLSTLLDSRGLPAATSSVCAYVEGNWSDILDFPAIHCIREAGLEAQTPQPAGTPV